MAKTEKEHRNGVNVPGSIYLEQNLKKEQPRKNYL